MTGRFGNKASVSPLFSSLIPDYEILVTESCLSDALLFGSTDDVHCFSVTDLK